MNRRLKKFLYGIFYLCVSGLISFGLYKSFFATAPTCFDKKQNQGETGVDCGGPCGNCDVLNLASLQILGEAKMFGLDSGKTVIVAEVKNPNSNYGASFFYSFRVYDDGGNLIGMKSGRGSIFQSEDKFIFESDVAAPFQRISRVEAEISETEWVAAEGLAKPDLEITDVSTINDVSGIKVGGAVRNNGASPASNLEIVGFILNKRGFRIFGSRTILPKESIPTRRKFSFPLNFRFFFRINAGIF